MARDSQRQKVYDAELAAFTGHHNHGVSGLSVADLQAYIDKWCSSKTLQRRYPAAATPPSVTDGRGRRRGGHKPASDELAMPTFARTRSYLLHELAHHLIHAEAQQNGEPSHGWRFCECYLYLVRVFLGRGSEEALKREYKARKVKFRAPRKSTMNPEQLEAARERMRRINDRRHDAKLLRRKADEHRAGFVEYVTA